MQPMMDAESLKRGGGAEKKPAAELPPSAPASETFSALSPGLSGSLHSKGGPGGASSRTSKRPVLTGGMSSNGI